MNIHILSDRHLESSDSDPPEIDADAVVLVGDIGAGVGGTELASRRLPKLPVIYIPGNHEFYIGDVGSLLIVALAYVQVLGDEVFEIDGVRSLGGML